MSEGFIFKNGGIHKRMPVTDSEAPAMSGASKEPSKVCKGYGRALPLSAFQLHPRSEDGHMSMCKECRRRKSATASSQGNPLEKFTARQLMHELKIRGYEGELKYVEIHKVRLSDM